MDGAATKVPSAAPTSGTEMIKLRFLAVKAKPEAEPWYLTMNNGSAARGAAKLLSYPNKPKEQPMMMALAMRRQVAHAGG